MATIYQKAKLLQSIFKGNTKKSSPLYIDIDLTTRCNLTCLGCPYHSVKTKSYLPNEIFIKDISFDLIKKLLYDLKKINTKEIILQGSGEPLLHPKIFKIISLAKKKRI